MVTWKNWVTKELGAILSYIFEYILTYLEGVNKTFWIYITVSFFNTLFPFFVYVLKILNILKKKS